MRKEQEAIFFKKRRRDLYNDEHPVQPMKPLVMKAQNGRYPNPEDMYNQFREMQDKNAARQNRRHKRGNSLWTSGMLPPPQQPRDRRNTQGPHGRSPARGGRSPDRYHGRGY